MHVPIPELCMASSKHAHTSIRCKPVQAIELKDCDVYAYKADDESNPFGDGACLWAFNFFFYNKKMKRILYISCRAVSKASAAAEVGAGMKQRVCTDICKAPHDWQSCIEHRRSSYALCTQNKLVVFCGPTPTGALSAAWLCLTAAWLRLHRRPRRRTQRRYTTATTRARMRSMAWPTQWTSEGPHPARVMPWLPGHVAQRTCCTAEACGPVAGSQ